MFSKTMEKTVFMIGVGNGSCIGGGMPICANAVVDDGLLDVVLVNEIKKRQIPGMLLKFLKGKHIGQPCTEEYRAKEVCIESLDGGKIETDGEIVDEQKLNCKVVHNVLKVFR